MSTVSSNAITSMFLALDEHLEQQLGDLIPFVPCAEDEVLERGTQILYVPTHILNDDGEFQRFHESAEWGFVTSSKTETVFCRFWRSGRSGRALSNPLNSQGVKREQIMRATSVTSDKVKEWLGYMP